VEGANLLVAVLACSLDADGRPLFAPSAYPGLQVGGGHLIPAFFDDAALEALRGGDALVVWAGTARRFWLDADGPGGDGMGVWRDMEGPLCPFGALTLDKACDAAQKAWLRAPRARRSA
jgi:hypothetical protein